ncbi:Trihelix transcription factor GT-3b [Sesamum alatum]|uniref:Trihelix transcription factor GT-3b n=1 Tax=Sesamum alatum TaxID=300844 RepID=A0AAE2CRW3_9LAMI|nr:Trihelix transcription factor GT-3b [Sesamum alatum]
MDQHHHHRQGHDNYSQLHHPSYAAGVSIDSGGGSDRFPQWSIQETRDFLIIRAELDPTFMDTKRNKLLWELVSTRMKQKGYNRSPGQCKCKWKNLVTRYKGCETMEAEEMRQQFPFYNEMQAIFTARMQRILWLEAEGGGAATTSKNKKALLPFSSDEEDDESEGEKGGGGVKKKRKLKVTTAGGGSSSKNSILNGIRGIMEKFMKQQMEMEMQWMKAYEEREEERRGKEMEWRERIEALEKERMMMETRWREREEQRKGREEARAQTRDALITALLNKLTTQANVN